MTTPGGTVSFILQEQVIFAKDNEQFLKQLTTLYGQIARSANSKDIGQYELIELLNGQRFFGANPQTNREVYRKVFQIGAVAIGGLSTIVHGITGLVRFTRMYGTVITAVVDDRPIPYVDTVAVTNQISVLRNGLNILIQNGATAPAITSGLLVVEYLKQ